MRFTILAAIVPLLSLTVAQGNWNCKNSDDPDYMKMDLQHRQAAPDGLCVNDGGLGLLAHRCTAGKPCKQNNNGCIPINDFEANCSS